MVDIGSIMDEPERGPVYSDALPERGPGYSDDLGDSGDISSSMGNVSYQYDEASDNYDLDISFNLGGSANYSLDADTVLELEANGGAFYNSSIRGSM